LITRSARYRSVESQRQVDAARELDETHRRHDVFANAFDVGRCPVVARVRFGDGRPGVQLQRLDHRRTRSRCIVASMVRIAPS
jgi:hypothetical protein